MNTDRPDHRFSISHSIDLSCKISPTSKTEKAARLILTNRLRVIIQICLAMVLVSSLTVGCQPVATPTHFTLRLALLPILDALPIYAAEQLGYFAAQGVKVSFVPVASAVERDQVMAAGQADGMINDLVAVTLYNRDQAQVQVVRFAQVATKKQPEYRILVSPKSKLAVPADLKGVDIGISKASVIEYVTERLLEAEGLAPADIHTTVVPKIPDRLSLLSSERLQAATLPEPFSTLAVKAGSRVLLDDSAHPEYGSSVISIRKTVIIDHQQEVAGFLKALEQAVTDIDRDPTRWSGLMRQYNLVPLGLVDSYPAPTYPAFSLPSETQFNDVVDWAINKGMISQRVNYQDSVIQAIGQGK